MIRIAAVALVVAALTACEVPDQGPVIDAGDIPDLDGDGVTVLEGDCDERSASLYPGAIEIIGNTRDDNCDGLQDQIVTIAGTGDPGSGGDAQPPTDADLNGPRGIAFDQHGNLYIADTYNNKVRMISSSTGKIITIAGTGTAGYSGDKGSATKAALNQPGAVACDPSGRVYVSDTDNNRIRRVDGGVIITYAGTGTAGFSGDNGPATRAALREPLGLVIDNDYNVYFADSGNDRIRVITPDGDIDTIVGDGSTGDGGDGGDPLDASLDTPSGVLLQGIHALFIADTGNHRIRRVALLDNIISTVAGSGDLGVEGDGGAATAANLASPLSMALDAYGDLFIADTGNSRVRIVEPNGLIATSVGTGEEGFSGDGGPPGLATLSEPSFVLIDPAGNLLISDTENHVIRSVQAVTATSP